MISILGEFVRKGTGIRRHVSKSRDHRKHTESKMGSLVEGRQIKGYFTATLGKRADNVKTASQNHEIDEGAMMVWGAT